MVTLKGLYRAAKLMRDYFFDYDGALQREFESVSGLPYAKDPQHKAEFRQIRSDLAAAFARMPIGDHLAEIERRLNGTRASGATMSNMMPHYALLMDELTEYILRNGREPEQLETLLPVYETWWKANRQSPSAAAAYAYALGTTGKCWRGNGWAKDVSNEAWDKLEHYVDGARAIMNESAPMAGDCLIWHTLNMRLGLIEGADRQTMAVRFERVQDLDPYNPSIYHDRLIQLLPRWGGSFAEMEVFAKQSASRTSDRFGNLLYARISWNALKFEHANNLLIDRALMLEGLDDWLRVHPSQGVANLYACHAHYQEKLDIVRRLFEEHIKEIHIDAWFQPHQPYQAFQACGLLDKRTAKDRVMVRRSRGYA